ncbi:MAG: EAL domain-containing protein [Rubellimicrobium sp.]|nr:EAL domain-containing protein [Rubellimicrobium sp.]
MTQRKALPGAVASPGRRRQSIDRQIVPLLDRLTACSLSDADQVIASVLAELGPIAKADRAYVFQRRDGDIVDNSHEWVARGIVPMKAQLQDLPMSVGVGFFDVLGQGKSFMIGDVSKLREGSDLRLLLEGQAIRSLLAAPYLDGTGMAGFIGLDWTRRLYNPRDMDLMLLESLAKGIGALLLRRRGARAEEAARARLASTLAAMPDIVTEYDADGRLVAIHSDRHRQLAEDATSLIGKRIEEFLPEETASLGRRMMSDVAQRRTTRQEEMELDLGAGPRTYDVVVTPIDGTETDGSGVAEGGCLVVLRDISAARQAQSATRDSEAQLRRLFEHAPFGILLQDLESGKVTDVNPAFLASSGHSRRRLLNRSLSQLMPGHVRQEAQTVEAALLGDGRYGPVELAFKRARSGHFPAEARGVVHAGPDGRRMVWTFVEDLTERRMQEAMIRARSLEAQEMRQKFETAFDAFPDGFVYFDAEGQLALFNRQFVEMHPGIEDQIRPGARNEDILRAGFERGLLVRMNGQHFDSFEDFLAVQSMPPFEREVELADGRIIRIKDMMTPDGGRVGVRTDVTATRRAEWRLSNVVEGALVGTWEWDVKTGTHTVNERWAGMLGRQLADLVPITVDTFWSLVHPDDRPRIEAVSSRTLSGELPQYEIEFRMLHDDGRWVWIQSRGRVLTRDRGATPRVMAGVHVDVSAIKEAEQRLEAAISGAEAGTWSVDLQRNEIEVDRRVAAILGQPPEVVAGWSMAAWLSRIHPADRRHIIAPLLAGRLIQDGQFSMELRLRHARGHWLWLLARGRVTITAPDGRPEGLSGISIDISEQRNREEALRKARDELEHALVERDRAERRFFDIAAISADWFWELDADLRLTFISESYARNGGQILLETGKRFEDLAFDDPALRNSAEWRTLLARLAAREPFRDHVFRASRPGESDVWIRLSGSPHTDSNGVFTGYRGVGSDITALYKAKARAEHLATRDPLTGLANRTAFHDALRNWAEGESDDAGRDTGRDNRRDRAARQGAVMMLDLDNFKTINDSFGHDAGDTLLQQVAARLEEAIRPGDLIARQGGDEFALLLRAARPEDAIDIAWRLIERLGQPFDLRGQSFFVSVSIGIALFPDDATTAADLLQNADIAMYRAKAAGRSQFAIFRPELRTEQARRTDMIQAIHRGLREDRFRLVLQPKFDLAPRPSLTGAEALLRWHDPEFLDVSPGVFVPLAESTGLIFEIDLMVVTRAAELLARWQDRGMRVPLAVNISAQSFQQAGIVDDLLSRINHAGADPALLQLEITETALMNRREQTFHNIRALERAGLGIVIDDFGTGYSSLSYLQGLPLSALKIDQSFVSKLGTGDTGTEAIVRAILAMACALGMGTVAEGVETMNQLDWLRDHDCGMVQGFLLGRPVEVAKFETDFGPLQPLGPVRQDHSVPEPAQWR